MSRLGPFKENTIVVGDCLDIMAQMPDGCVDSVLTDPPYALNKGFAGEEFTENELHLLLGQVASMLKRICKPNANILLDASIQRLPLFLRAITPELNFMWQLIWFQPNRMGSRSKAGFGAYSSFLWFSNGVGKRTMVAKDVFKYSTIGGRQPDRDWHPTFKPLEVYGRWIQLLSREGDLIFDPFIGSGTTAVVADRLGRKFFGCDISEEYVEMALERLEKDRAGRQLQLL